MTKINPRSAGLALGAFAAAVHLAWVVLVATGVAQPLINFIFWLHFINPPYKIAPFELGTAALLIVFVSVVAFGFGYLLAAFWNSFARRRA